MFFFFSNKEGTVFNKGINLESSAFSTSGIATKLFADKLISTRDGRFKTSLGMLCS